RKARSCAPSPGRPKASAEPPGIAGDARQVRTQPSLPLKTVAPVRQVRTQPSYLRVGAHLSHRRESKRPSEGELGEKDTANHRRPRWCSKVASFSPGAGSRRVRRRVACATVFGCLRTCVRRRQNEQQLRDRQKTESRDDGQHTP